ISFGDQHLSQHAAGAFTCEFAQRIVDGLTLTERKNSGISRHGVSLLSGGSGRLDTRLDTPPSINRRHLDSPIAPNRPLQGSVGEGENLKISYILGTETNRDKPRQLSQSVPRILRRASGWHPPNHHAWRNETASRW